MKKLLAIVVITIIGLTIALPYKMAQSHSAIPPTQSTGAPGESTCESCHSSFALNSGVGKITIAIDTENDYKADTTYTITIIVKDTTEKDYGFELTALDSNNNAAGTFTLTNTSNTDEQSGHSPTRHYIGHKNANSNNTWTFDWTAPSSNIGKITFYACGVAGNDNGGSDGDEVYTTDLNIKFDTTTVLTGIEQPVVNHAALTVYPEPAAGFLNLSLQMIGPSPLTISLSDITGKMIAKWNFNLQPAGQFKQLLSLNHLSLYNGLYLISVSTNYSEQYKKILIQNN